MWWQYLIVGLLLLIAGICKAIQDTLEFHFDSSIFKKIKNQDYWNPLNSWKRKWKNDDIKQGEKFLGSSSIFVSLTDAWHFFGLIRDFSFVAAATIASLNPWYLIGYIIFFGSFHIFFTWIFKN